MSLTLAGATAIAAGAGAAGNVIGTGAQMLYNKKEAERNRQFQEHMRDTAMISAVNQANELGISPSMILGGGNSGSLGGSQASVGGGQNPLGHSANILMDYIKQDRQMDLQERLQEERIEAQKEIEQMKIQNASSTTAVNEERQRISRENQRKWAEEYRQEQWKKLGIK